MRCAALLIALLFLGCAASGGGPLKIGLAPDEERIDVSYRLECDQVSGRQVCVMVGNPLLPLTPRYPMLSLGALREDAGAGGAPRFFLRAVYVNQGPWLHIARGASLTLEIDGERLELAGEGSDDERVEGASGKVFEVALYPVSVELLQRIADARQIYVSLRGDRVLEKRFNAQNRVYFHMFLKKNPGARP